MIYKLLHENIQDIVDKKIKFNTKKNFNIVLNEFKYNHIYKNYYTSSNIIIYINNYILGCFTITNNYTQSYIIYIKYGNINKRYTTHNKLIFLKKKQLIIDTVYKWNIKKIVKYNTFNS